MTKPGRLASFCRLCLVKSNESKVSLFEDQSGALLDLLKLIELDIDAKAEPNAVICYECVVTLEGFLQFKEQCHTNDEFLKTVPAAPEGEEEDDDDVEYLEEDSPAQVGLDDDEEEENDVVEVLHADSEPEEGLVTEESEIIASPKAKKAKVVAKSQEMKPSPQPHKRSDSVPKLDIEEIDRQCKEHNIKANRHSEGPKLDDLQVLKDSYPDYFYFEKGPRSQYFKLVFYGEKFHISNFTERYTYWVCVHRKKRRCPAQVCVRNDYTDFERRYNHNHGQLKEKDDKAYTPHQALPELFKICREKVQHKTALRRKKILDRELRKMEEGPETDEEVNGRASAGLKRVLRESGILDGLEESDLEESE